MTAESGVPRNSLNRFAHIDAMRAFAVTLVVVAHCGLGFVVPGGSGVTIFFAISGFIITHLLLRERDRTGSFAIRGFYLRRVLKLAPPFAIAVLLPSLVYSLWHPLDWSAVAAQLLFAYNWFKAVGIPEVLPGSGVVWSLAIEEQFYLCFAAIWLFLVRTRARPWALVAVAAAGIAVGTLSRLALELGGASAERIYYGSDSRIDAIAWGVLLAAVYRYGLAGRNPASRAIRFFGGGWAPLAAFVLYTASLLYRADFFQNTASYSLQSLAACLMILYGLLPGDGLGKRMLYRASTMRLVSTIGLASYSIYLVHLELAAQLQPLFAGAPLWLSATALSGAGILAGVLLYYAVEVPARRLGRRLPAPRRHRPRHAARDAPAELPDAAREAGLG